MKELLGDVELNLEQATCIARAMWALAKIDGIHPRERQMISAFYQSCAEGAAATDLDAIPFSVDDARRLLFSEAQQEAFVKSCWLAALADGAASAKEAAWIESVTAQMGISAEDHQKWASETRLFLFGMFASDSAFPEEIAEIGRSLGLTPEELRSVQGG